MSFINAGGPKEALSSLIQSLLKALVRSNLPLRRSWIANDVHSFCAMFCLRWLDPVKGTIWFDPVPSHYLLREEVSSQTTEPYCHWPIIRLKLLHLSTFLCHTPCLKLVCGTVHVFITNLKIHSRKISLNEYFKAILHYLGVDSLSGLTTDRCTELSWNRPVWFSVVDLIHRSHR